MQIVGWKLDNWIGRSSYSGFKVNLCYSCMSFLIINLHIGRTQSPTLVHPWMGSKLYQANLSILFDFLTPKVYLIWGKNLTAQSSVDSSLILYTYNVRKQCYFIWCTTPFTALQACKILIVFSFASFWPQSLPDHIWLGVHKARLTYLCLNVSQNLLNHQTSPVKFLVLVILTDDCKLCVDSHQGMFSCLSKMTICLMTLLL